MLYHQDTGLPERDAQHWWPSGLADRQAGRDARRQPDSLRGSSVKLGRIQSRLAWPLRKDDTHKLRSGNNNLPPYTTWCGLRQAGVGTKQRSGANEVNESALT